MEAIADGRALEGFIKRQIELSAHIHSILELSRASGIRASTMYEWFSEVRAPRTDSLARVGAALGVPASRLLDAYEQQRLVVEGDPPPGRAGVVLLCLNLERGLLAHGESIEVKGRQDSGAAEEVFVRVGPSDEAEPAISHDLLDRPDGPWRSCPPGDARARSGIGT